MLTTFEAISLMLAFGMLLITLLAYLDRENKRKNKPTLYLAVQAGLKTKLRG